MIERPHVVILHRWRARYAEYERYLDHEQYAVSYITTMVGADAVPSTAASVVQVGATDDLPSVRSQLDRLAKRHGPPRFIVGLKEDDLLVAAQLSAEWNCCVRSTEELLPFRDKLVMARTVARAGIAAPELAPAPDRDAVRAFAETHGWPVILKPRLGSSSEGVVRVSGPSQLKDVEIEHSDAVVVQEYDPHDIYHVDGVFDGRGLGPWRASRYLNTCLGFRGGELLGSVEEDNPTVNEAVDAFTLAVLGALTINSTVFHLEVFVHDRASQEPSCAFLEIGARVGGSEIAFLWRELYGYDLMEAAVRIALAETPRPCASASRQQDVGGWLLAPAPVVRPCRVSKATSMVGRSPGPYAEALLKPGEVLPAADSYYEHVGGRFRFRGPTSAAVQEAIEATARDFRVHAEACVSIT